MARLRTFNVFSNLDDEEFERFVSAYLSDLTGQFNGNIQFRENIRASGIHSVSIPDASTIVSVSHDLGRVPDGFILIKPLNPETMYAANIDTHAWTDRTVYLKASGALQASFYLI